MDNMQTWTVWQQGAFSRSQGARGGHRRVGHDGTDMCPALVLPQAQTRAVFTHGMHCACTTSHAACTPRALHGILFSFLVSQKKRKNETNAGWVQITRRRCKAPPGASLPKEQVSQTQPAAGFAVKSLSRLNCITFHECCHILTKIKRICTVSYFRELD